MTAIAVILAVVWGIVGGMVTLSVFEDRGYNRFLGVLLGAAVGFAANLGLFLGAASVIKYLFEDTRFESGASFALLLISLLLGFIPLLLLWLAIAFFFPAEGKLKRAGTVTRRSLPNLLPYVGRSYFWIMVLLIAFYTMAPFFYAISISFRTNSQVLVTARYTPEDPSLVNYQLLFDDSDFMRTMLNSSIVSTVTVIGSLIVGSFAAYALGRVQFKGRMTVLYLVLAMTMFPQISILSGLFAIVNDLKIYGSTAALMFTYPIFTLPFTVWVLTSFFQGLPGEIEQAALVDGASPFQTFWRILVPLTAPALVTTGLLAFISAWNEYLFALTFTLVSKASQTVPVAIANFGGYGYEVPVANRIAATVIVTVPVLVLVLIFQRRIIEGLTAGAVKG